MERFEHFELQRELGRGATAKIYLARNLKTNDQVSIKIFHPKIFHDAHFAQRIQREIKLSASLKHDNIVQVREVITHTDPPALVMDYIEGENLEVFQSRLPYILPEVSALIVVEILKGLEYAHAQGLIHRDLKPENVLIRKDGRVYVTDFGLAKLADTTLITQANVILGSLDYMSPEQSLGDSVAPTSDLFSVAVMLYFLTTGTRPFSRETTLSTLQAIRQEPAEHPAKRNPKLSPELCRIIMKGMSKKCEDRYSTAKEFRECLEKYLSKLGLTSEEFGVTHWIKEPTGMTMEGLRVTVENLTKSCEGALKDKRKDVFLETLAHLTLKAPQSPAIARLTTSYRQSIDGKRRPLYYALAVVLVLLLGPCSYYLYTQKMQVLPPPTTTTTDTVTPPVPTPTEVDPLTRPRNNNAKVVTPTEEETSPPSEVKPPRRTQPPVTAKNPLTPKKPTGTVRFNVGQGVQVFWDGREVNPNQPLPNQTVGRHTIMLLSPGFDPIRGEVLVKEGEPTMVNAQ